MCYHAREMADSTETRTRKVSCPYRHNAKVVKNGRNANGKQTYRCKNCRKRFLHTGQVAGHRVPTEQVGAASQMYCNGTSYKLTAETMDDAYDMSEPLTGYLPGKGLGRGLILTTLGLAHVIAGHGQIHVLAVAGDPGVERRRGQWLE